MKKLIFLSLALFCLSVGSAWAQVFVQGNFSFTVTDAEAKTVGVQRANNLISGEMVIPATVVYEGVTYTVTKVTNNAFKNTAITSVTIPATVTNIGDRAFEGCNALTDFTIQDGDEPLSLTAGFYGIMYSCDADKTVYIGRDLVLSENSAPFPNAKSVTFGDKVTAIHRNLFQNSYKLGSVAIGKNVRSIGESAFSRAGTDDSVEEMTVTMGENVTEIGVSAFDGCRKLKAVTLPEKLTFIFSNAFHAVGLTSISIPASVDSIGDRAFADCSNIANIRIENKAEALKMWNGFYGTFYNSTGDKTLYIGRDLKLNEITALASNVTSVKFGDQVTTINPSLFYEVNKLASIKMGSGIKTIGYDAFYESGDDETIAEMIVELGENIETIGSRAFGGCDKLMSVVLPSTLTTIEGNAFVETGLTGITIPASVDSIGERAFASNVNLASIRIEDKAEPLKMAVGFYGTFYNSNADKTVYIGRDLTLNEINALASNVTSVEFGDQVTAVNPKLFSEVDKLASVKMGSGIKTIGYDAFYETGDDETIEEMVVNIGENVTIIGQHAFNGCDKLKTVTLPSVLETIEGNAFDNAGLTGITIPASVDSIGERAFGSNANLASIRIDDKAEPLKMAVGFYGTFYNCNADKTVYIGRDLTLNEINALASNVTSVKFGDQVTAVNPKLFSGVDKLASVKMGSGIKTIGYEAFYETGDDETIDEMVVSIGENVTFIGQHAFNGCDKLKTVTLPSVLKIIEGNAFDNAGLTGITIPASVDSIGDRTFASNANLASIRIEDKAEPLKITNGFYGIFYNSNADKTMYIGRDLTYTDITTLASNVTSVEFGELVTTVNPKIFSGVNKLASVKMGSGIKTVGNEAFYETGDDETIEEMIVNFGGNVTFIGQHAFNGCDKLKTVELPSTLKIIEGNAFENAGLTAIAIPASVDSIGERSFASCASLTNIRFEDGAQPLKMLSGFYGTFYNCSGEKNVHVGRNLELSENSAPIANVKTVTFGETVTALPATMFSNSTLVKVSAPWLQPIDIVQSVFNNATYQTAYLSVPGGTVEAYRAHQVWNKFLNIQPGSYFVTATASAGGKLRFEGITVSNETKKMLVERESDVTFEVAADENYDFTSLTINGDAVPVENGKYTYQNLLSDINVEAKFTEKPQFEVKATATGGTVSLNGATPSASQSIKVYRDKGVVLAIAAAEGYEQPKVTVNGQDVTSQLKDDKLTIDNIQEAQNIVVTFAKKTFQIAVEPTQNGSIELSKTTVEWGDSFSATFKPSTGYEFATATLNGKDVTAQVKDNVLTVNNVKEAQTVGGTFKKQMFTVSVSGAGVSVSTTNPMYGDRVIVTIEDDPDRTLLSLLVNGQDVTAQVVNGQYVIENVTGNVTVEATFRSTKEFITLSGDMATFSCEQDLNFTGSDLKAYIAAGYNKQENEVLLVRVYDVPAGTGVVLKGTKNTTYKVPYYESKSYYVNLLRPQLTPGQVTPTTGNMSNFILQEEDSEAKFFAPESPVMLAGKKAYLQVPTDFFAGVRFVKIVFAEEEGDGIDRFEMVGRSENGAVYNLGGQRVQKAGRGIYIENGRKVLRK